MLEIATVDAVAGENTEVPYCEDAEEAARSAREAENGKREEESAASSRSPTS